MAKLAYYSETALVREFDYNVDWATNVHNPDTYRTKLSPIITRMKKVQCEVITRMNTSTFHHNRYVVLSQIASYMETAICKQEDRMRDAVRLYLVRPSL